MTFKGSTLNVSPLCQGCDLIEFADKNNIMFHQCEICKDEYDKWRLLAYSVNTQKEDEHHAHIYMKEYTGETQIVYCPWCGRKL